METEVLKRTPLYSLHIKQGAKLVPFAGYEMPVQYSDGVKQEHLYTRHHVGLFDISHMGQVKLSGNNAANMLESLTPGNFQQLKLNTQRYTVLTNEQGGIIDDLMVTNAGGYFFIVVNAACKQNDIVYLRSRLMDGCELEELNDALLSLQGPEAASIMQRLCPEAAELVFMTGKQFSLNGINCFINRCGYTGEDGFEISVPADQVEDLTHFFLKEENIKLIGLGARDSLRLEAGLCLYGHDIDENTSPVEANLNWIISKSRLEDNTQSFPGIDIIRNQLEKGTDRLRVGLLSDGRAPIREGTHILNDKEETIGIVTSGGFGPSVEKPIAMGYIDKQHAVTGTKLNVKIRDRIQQVNVVALPFVKHQYYKK